MKKIIPVALASLAALTVATPALAQRYGSSAGQAHGGWDLDRRLNWMQQRIDHGRADGSLDPREARRVQDELINIRRDQHMMRDRHAGMLSPVDRMVLQNRLDRLNGQIRWLRRNDERLPW